MKRVLYITYIDILNGEAASGSAVRPKRMYESLLKKGYDVILLEGSQLRSNKAIRLSRIREIERIVNKNAIDYCYIELPTTPITFFDDLRLIKTISKKSIKIGAFYRDFDWKYSYISQDKGLKKIYHWFCFKIDIYIFRKNIDILFFPTEGARKLFSSLEKLPYYRTSVLPPGMDFHINAHSQIFYNAIYVGGVSSIYKIELFLEAFNRINQNGTRITMTLVCREAELQERKNILNKYLECDWLNVVHTSNTEILKQLYQKSDFGISTLSINEYTNICMPIKLGEYLSYGLPIIATECVEIKKFLDEYRCGLTCKDNVIDIQNNIESFYNNENLRTALKQNVQQAVQKNSWLSRVNIIEEQLHVK